MMKSKDDSYEPASGATSPLCEMTVHLQPQDQVALAREELPAGLVLTPKAGSESQLAEQPINSSNITFKVQARGQNYNFYIAEEANKWQAIAEAVNGRILSTNIAGGFVGTYIGMYASSNGASPSLAYADFDWFEYISID